MKAERIAVLTSGGDAPGMNAAIRAVVRTAKAKAEKENRTIEVVGIRHGYNGLVNIGEIIQATGGYDIENDPQKNAILMELRTVSGIIHKGGTMLYTARSNRFRTPQGVALGKLACKVLNIKGIVVIGGDGSFAGANDLCTGEDAVHCIGIPGTIDNDIRCTEYTIGFDTAMNTAMEMTDKIRDTMEAHDRCCIIEVMGRNAGDLALYTGIAVGATAVLIPEKVNTMEDVVNEVSDRIEETRKTGKEYFIIVAAEGVSFKLGISTQTIANAIELKIKEIIKRERESLSELERKALEVEDIEEKTRVTVLGHVQRGGCPTARDRAVASQMGNHAVELLLEGQSAKIVIMKDGRITNCDFALSRKDAPAKPFDEKFYAVAHELSI
ncbi:MAG: 6-phosphofructokinase [Oscillospiraceae bacterium]|jgi:6-phosphofructokinase 1|nr:6-phosphofructokinase [Oscillospiraceae bacterium]